MFTLLLSLINIRNQYHTLLLDKIKPYCLILALVWFRIRPVVEQITNLPIIVINSHTHFDHVGGNWEFSNILAIDTSYTKANMDGFQHNRIAQDFTSNSFCIDPPINADLENIYTKQWEASEYIKDGDTIDLGDRDH